MQKLLKKSDYKNNNGKIRVKIRFKFQTFIMYCFSVAIVCLMNTARKNVLLYSRTLNAEPYLYCIYTVNGCPASSSIESVFYAVCCPHGPGPPGPAGVGEGGGEHAASGPEPGGLGGRAQDQRGHRGLGLQLRHGARRESDQPQRQPQDVCQAGRGRGE